MTIPRLGVFQANEPFWGLPPRVVSSALVHWRGEDGTLQPLTGQLVERTPPTVPGTLLTSRAGVTRPYPPGLAGWEPRPWDDGVGGLRDELGCRLADDERWRVRSAGNGGALRLAVGPLSWLHEWTELGGAWAENAPLAGLATAADLADLSTATGASLVLVRRAEGVVAAEFRNGVDSAVASTVSGVAAGDRLSLRAWLELVTPTTARVIAHLVRNGGAESAGTPSAAIPLPAVWGDSDNASVFVRAPQWLRTTHLRAGTHPRGALTTTL